MREVVVVPTANRPEFLALTLEKLEQATDVPDDVRIYLDTSSDERLEEVEYVRDIYLPRAMIFHAKPHIKAPSGTWNILNAIKQGYGTGVESVFLIEEDVLIYPRFFSWHRAQDCLASCGRKDLRFYPIHGPLYTNPGSCLRRPLLKRLVSHIKDAYFTGLRDYLDREFGPWLEITALDDGLIRRVMRQMGQPFAVFPEAPVCVHQGFRAYNALVTDDFSYMNSGDIKQRIAGLRDMISKIKPGDRYTKDFEPF